MYSSLKKVVLIFLLVLLAGLISFVTYIEFAGYKYINRIAFAQLRSSIQSTPPLPQAFYDTYDDIYPNALQHGVYSYMFSVINGSHSECPCYSIAKYSFDNNRRQFHFILASFSISRLLEKEVTQRQCLNYIMSRNDFLFDNISLNQAAKFYFKKTVYKLSQDEVTSLLIMYGNPRYYNPMLYPDRLKAKVEEFNATQLK